MEAFLIFLAIVLVAGGIIFSILPPLPGPVLAFGAMLIMYFTSAQVSGWVVFFFGILTLGITALDYVLPVAATKKFGGTKAGIWGGIIGTIIGVLFFPGIGIIIGPLLGAIIGDLIGGNQIRAAVKSGVGSFIGFVIATFIKVSFCIVIGVIVAVDAAVYAGPRLVEFFSNLFS
ncbi:MAG: DUF456 domain-containing protein [Cyclobacteriaceae bacterium]